MELNQQNFAKVVQDARISCGMTQKQLAEKAGCSQRLVSELEHGSSPRFDKALSLFAALGLRVEVLPAKPTAQREIAALKAQVEKTLWPESAVQPAASENADACAASRTHKPRPRLADYLEEA